MNHAYDAALMLRRANYYVGNLAFAITPVKYGEKNPVFGRGWNKRENLLTTTEQVSQWYAQAHNIGVHLGASGINSLDIDDMDLARAAFQEAGLSLDDILEQHPHVIQGAGYRLWFLAGEDDPIQSRRFLNVNDETAYEIRGGDGFQDVAPGSLHPNGYEYRWTKGAPRSRSDLPQTPAWLYALYEHLAERTDKPVTPAPKGERREYTGPSVIEAYNARYTVQEVLERSGYKRRGNRYLSPNSKTKLAGIEIYQDGSKSRAVSYHASDFWADKKGHDAFDLFTLLEHDGDFTRALSAARHELGMDTPAPQDTTSPEWTPEQVQAAWEVHSASVLERAANILGAQMHHRALQAVVDLLGWAYQSAAEGHLKQTPKGEWAVQVGGVKGFAALLGCHPSDLRARLDMLSDRGFLRTSRVNPSDPQSGVQILLPTDPLTLPFLAQQQEASKSPLRPRTREIKRDRTLSAPPIKSMAKAGGRIKKTPSLRALLRVALVLAQHPGLDLKALAGRLHMRRDTLRRKLSELDALGYLTTGGALRCTFAQFFADARAEGADAAFLRVSSVLESQKSYFERELLLSRLRGERVPLRLQRRLTRTVDRLDRLSNGEMPHMVLGGGLMPTAEELGREPGRCGSCVRWEPDEYGMGLCPPGSKGARVA